LLKFAHDRTRFVMWLREARKRFGVQILNYAVTSNHVHLLVKDSGDAGSIPSAIQLVAGRTGQEYNHRKRRKGAFWEDRYHATAIAEWVHGGYHEIQGQRRRNSILALDVLAQAVEAGSREELARAHREWIEAALSSDRYKREEFWSKSIAVGSADFVRKTQQMLGMRGKGRDVVSVGDSFVLRESQQSYGTNFTPENRPIALNNAHYWGDCL
jgi:putative transposase